MNYSTRDRVYGVYVTRDERVHSKTYWALFAMTYNSEDEARKAAIRAVNSGYKHAQIRITQLFSAAED